MCVLVGIPHYVQLRCVYTFILKDDLKDKNKPEIFLSVPTTCTYIYSKEDKESGT